MEPRIYASAGAGLLLVWYYLSTKRNRGKRFPPGPKPLPLIGNLFDFPQKKAWLTFAKWRELYGDIIYVNMLGQPIVVLNSRKTCDDLLEKRSKIYSSRPRFVMLNELMGWDYAFSLMPYSPRWRLHRRLFHRFFNETDARDHIITQEQTTHHFLRNLLKQPEAFRSHIRLFFSETIMEVLYGYKIEGHEDPYIKTIQAAVHAFTIAGKPGRFLVDTFPLLKIFPSWFPGAGFKTQAAEWKKYILASRNDPAAYVQRQTENGTAQPSVLASMISTFGNEGEESSDVGETVLDAAKAVCATGYGAAADTTLSLFEGFFLAMANHPECQKLAQAELDTLLGGSRLPTFEDRRDLPYITAIVKELLRWHVVAPGSIAHVLDEDDEYEGYSIPKGTIVIPNAWGILHDPEIYPDPHTFNPSRWLVNTPEGKKMNTNIPDPSIATFGFGRRICPGRFFAENSLLISVAKVLSVFTISPLDVNGAPAERCEEGLSDGVLVYPLPYYVTIKPRSAKAAQLINETES